MRTLASIMRTLASFVLALLIGLAAASPAFARVVVMQTSAALENHTEPAIERALREALDVALDGAVAMGLSWMRVDRARVLDDAVVVWVVASDEEMDDSDDAGGIELERETI